MTTELQTVFNEAVRARTNAHAPYSKYLVGSAILTENGEIFGGCNVENASYGGTVCAERVAIFKAVSEKGRLKIQDVVVVTDQVHPWPPCGFCRQVISEFATEKTMIHMANLSGIKISVSFNEIFPSGFSPDNLK